MPMNFEPNLSDQYRERMRNAHERNILFHFRYRAPITAAYCERFNSPSRGQSRTRPTRFVFCLGLKVKGQGQPSRWRRTFSRPELLERYRAHGFSVVGETELSHIGNLRTDCEVNCTVQGYFLANDFAHADWRLDQIATFVADWMDVPYTEREIRWRGRPMAVRVAIYPERGELKPVDEEVKIHEGFCLFDDPYAPEP